MILVGGAFVDAQLENPRSARLGGRGRRELGPFLEGLQEGALHAVEGGLLGRRVQKGRAGLHVLGVFRQVRFHGGQHFGVSAWHQDVNRGRIRPNRQIEDADGADAQAVQCRDQGSSRR